MRLSSRRQALLAAGLTTLGIVDAASTRAGAAAPQEPNASLTALDKIEIMELASRFEMALDREDVDAFLAVYRDDGVLEGVAPEPARGKAELRTAFYGMLNTFARGRRHCSTNQIIRGDRTKATMISYLTVFNRNDLFRRGSAVVTDTAVYDNGAWYLSARKIEVDPSFATAPAGR